MIIFQEKLERILFLYYYMTMIRTFVIVFTLLFFTHIVIAEQSITTNVEQYGIKDDSENIKEVTKYLKSRQEELEKAQKTREPESPLRRFEIQFFSAGAMAYVSSWLLARIFAAVTISQSSELPDTYWYFVITNSVGMATYIAVKDYYDVKRVNTIDKEKYGISGHSTYKLCLLDIKF